MKIWKLAKKNQGPVDEEIIQSLTTIEREAVLKHLSVFIRMKKVPCKADIEKNKLIKNNVLMEGHGEMLRIFDIMK